MNLIEYIKHNYDKHFKESDIPFTVVRKNVKKGSIIHAYSEIGYKMYFLNQGITESTVLYGEMEKTLSFYFPNSFFSAFTSIIANNPSHVQITAITDCVVEEYFIADYQKACESSLLLNKIGRVEMEQAFIKKNQREIDFLTKTTEEMYLDLMKNNPEVLQNVPLKKIANYFGVLPETLSRIRKRIIT